MYTYTYTGKWYDTISKNKNKKNYINIQSIVPYSYHITSSYRATTHTHNTHRTTHNTTQSTQALAIINTNTNENTIQARFTIRTFLSLNLTRNKKEEQSFVRMPVRSVPALSCPVCLELHLQIIINLFFLFYWNASSTFLYGKKTFCPKYCSVSTFISIPFFSFFLLFFSCTGFSFLLYFPSLLATSYLILFPLFFHHSYFISVVCTISYLIPQYYYNYFTS